MSSETVIVEGEAVDQVSAMIERVKTQALAPKKTPRRHEAHPAKRKKRKAVEKARRRNRR